MKTGFLLSAALAAAISAGFALTPARADDMKKDGMTKSDKMDKMDKKDAMKSDAMKKDGMKDGMKDDMKKDDMKK